MLKRFLLIAALAASPAAASPEFVLPTLFDVSGVAADDVLNIRAEPSAGADILGTLDPDATGIEVVALDHSGGWGRINLGESSGWVSMRFLNYRTDVWLEDALPETLRCGGTEPFWGVVPDGGGMVFSTPDGETRYDGAEVFATSFFRNPRRVFAASGDEGGLWGSIAPAACNDGMSDRVFGLDAMLILDDGGARRFYHGCCEIQPR